MSKFKKIISVLVVILGAFWYASQPTARSLYSTKADASSEYQLIGKVNEQVFVEQRIIFENDTVQQIEVLLHTVNTSNANVTWQLETSDGQVVVSGTDVLSQLLNESKNKMIIAFNNSKLKAGEMYRLKITGQIGGLLYYTQPRFANQTISMNNQKQQQALVAKVVYQGLHSHTFMVLLGLIAYIVLFMSVMLKLFR